MLLSIDDSAALKASLVDWAVFGPSTKQIVKVNHVIALTMANHMHVDSFSHLL